MVNYLAAKLGEEGGGSELGEMMEVNFRLAPNRCSKLSRGQSLTGSQFGDPWGRLG